MRGGVSAEMETSGPAWLRYGPLAGAEPTGIPAARGQTRRVGGALPGLVRRAWSGLGPVLAVLPGLGAWWGSVGKGHLAGGHPKRSRLEGKVRHGYWWRFQAPRHSAARESLRLSFPGRDVWRGCSLRTDPSCSQIETDVLFSFLLYRIF